MRSPGDRGATKPGKLRPSSFKASPQPSTPSRPTPSPVPAPAHTIQDPRKPQNCLGGGGGGGGPLRTKASPTLYGGFAFGCLGALNTEAWVWRLVLRVSGFFWPGTWDAINKIQKGRKSRNAILRKIQKGTQSLPKSRIEPQEACNRISNLWLAGFFNLSLGFRV